MSGLTWGIGWGIGVEGERAAIQFPFSGEAHKFHLAVQELETAGSNQGLVQAAALGHDCAAGLLDPAAHKHTDELGVEVGLAGLQQLLAQHHRASGHTHHIAVEEANVLGFIPSGDQIDQGQVGADFAAASTQGLFAGDLDIGEVGIGGDALGGPDGIKQGGEDGAVGGEAATASRAAAGPRGAWAKSLGAQAIGTAIGLVAGAAADAAVGL